MTVLHSPILSHLLAHDAWATRRLLEHASLLDDAALDRPFDIGPGCLRATFTHIVSAMARWADRITECEIRPTLESRLDPTCAPLSVADLLAALDHGARDLVESACLAEQRGLTGFIVARFTNAAGHTREITMTRAGALVHVATHGMHHRAQCLNMLRRLNIPGISDTLPDLDAIDYELAARNAAVSS